MKTLFVLIILGLLVVLMHQQIVSKRSEEIAQHKFALGWPMEDVRASLGEPALIRSGGNGTQTWIYPDGQTVTFSNFGKLFDSGHVAPLGAATPAARQAPFVTRRLPSSVPDNRPVDSYQRAGLGGN